MTFVYRIIYQPGVNSVLRSLNKMLSFAFPKVKLPPSGKITLSLKDGSTFKFHTNQTDPVGQKIYWHGVYYYEYIDIFEDIIRQCGVFVDIGSNAGLYSMIAARVSDDMKVIAFDPTNASTHYFTKNIAANNFESKINFFQMAISDVKGMISFYEVRNKKYPFLKHNLGGAASAVNKPTEYEEVEVPSSPLMDVLKENNLDQLKIDFVKIDAEGVEPLIIKGMDQVIREDQPIIVCEILFGQIEEELDKVFAPYNYRFFYHTEKGLEEVESIARESDNEVRNCFIVPESKMHLIQPHVAG